MNHVHKWNTNPPTKGRSWCIKCNHVFKGRGRPMRSDSQLDEDFAPVPVDHSALVEIASEMSGVTVEDTVSSIASGKQDDLDDSPVKPEVLPTGFTPPRPTGWQKHAGPRVAKLFVTILEAAGDWFKPPRKPKEVEDSDLQEFGDAMGDQLALWFPDSELTPLKRLVLAGASMGATMYMGAEKLPPKGTETKSASVQDAVLPTNHVPETIKPKEVQVPQKVKNLFSGM